MSPKLLNSWPDNAIGADEMLFEVIGDDIRDKQITAFDTVLGSELSFRIGDFITPLRRIRCQTRISLYDVAFIPPARREFAHRDVTSVIGAEDVETQG